ncbi:DUF2017 family protein [Intrasporangium sp.]|uniref:DUF2017 family protein n=1 Tax=Intrasporangium sp. TaxID=1925024 RepID=UPI003221EEE6
MARAFVRDGARFVAVLDETERVVLAGLMQQTRMLLAPEVEPTGDEWGDLVASLGASLKGDRAGGADDERDPALDRLLPVGHRGDDAIAVEFRRLTEEGLRQRKSGNLDVAVERLRSARRGRVVLDQAAATAFVMALTDVRLLLGERLGLHTEQDADALYASLDELDELDEDDPTGYAVAWYDFLTWLQETLTTALMGETGPGV